MSQDNPRGIQKGGGFFADMTNRIKLIARLMGDSRVNPFIKVLPVATLVYLLFPDIPGPIDDAAIIWLGSYLFVELCPPGVVQEHMDALNRVIPAQWHDPVGDGDETTIDAEFRETPPTDDKPLE